MFEGFRKPMRGEYLKLKEDNIFFRITCPAGRDDYSDYDVKKIISINIFNLMAMSILAVMGFILMINGMFFGAVSDMVFIILVFAGVLSFRISGNYELYKYLVILICGVFFICLVTTGGVDNSGPLWCYVFPLVTYYVLGHRKGTIAIAVMMFIYGVILYFPGTPFLFTEYTLIFKTRFILSLLFVSAVAFVLELSRYNAYREQKRLIIELQDALDEVDTISGLIPICAKCKKVKNDRGFWEQVETYIEKRSKALFSHGLCKDCAEELYGNEAWYKK